VYVFTGVGTTWTQQQKLLASDEAEGDVFGYSVSLSGDTALIGAKWDDDKGESSGSVYVFIRNGTTWVQQAKLLASDGASQDIFGCSVSLDDDTALVGSKGSAYVFTRSDTSWTQQAKLIASDGGVGNYFGYSVSLSDETVLIGAPAANDNGNNSGSAYVFIRTGTTWTQQAKLIASDGAANDLFGSSVSLSGENALIGAKWDDDNGLGSGSAYVFTRTGANWTQQVKLIAPDGAENDEFGYSVSLFEDIALIAAPKDDNNKNASGSVYVFTKGGDNEPPKTPGFEIIVVIGAIALVMFWKRKRKHVD